MPATPTTALFIDLGAKRYPVASFADASQQFCAARDAWGALARDNGASAMPDVFIVDGSGQRVARISYNGRVWPAAEWTPDMRPLYDNRESV